MGREVFKAECGTLSGAESARGPQTGRQPHGVKICADGSVKPGWGRGGTCRELGGTVQRKGTPLHRPVYFSRKILSPPRNGSRNETVAGAEGGSRAGSLALRENSVYECGIHRPSFHLQGAGRGEREAQPGGSRPGAHTDWCPPPWQGRALCHPDDPVLGTCPTKGELSSWCPQVRR